MKIVFVKQDSSWSVIEDSKFDDNLYLDYSSSAWHWANRASKFISKNELISILKGFVFADCSDDDKLILANYGIGTVEEIDTILTKDQQIDIIQNSYAKILTDGTKESDGKNYFNRFRSEMVYDYKHGIKSNIIIFTIENILSDVTAKLITGDWMSALYLISNITTTEIFTQSIKDKMIYDFNNYITNNY